MYRVLKDVKKEISKMSIGSKESASGEFVKENKKMIRGLNMYFASAFTMQDTSNTSNNP